MQRADIAAAVIVQRRSLIDDLAGLDPTQWDRPTACAGWSVHDVLAHVSDTASCTRATFVVDMIASRGDFDAANQRGVDRRRRADPDQTLAEFRDAVDRTVGPPAPAATRLVEVVVHGEDIRRALDLEHRYPAEIVATALEYQHTAAASVGGGRERAAGLRLVATDSAYDAGSGPEVTGTTLALLLALCGRPVRPGELTGPGAVRLTGPGSDRWDRERLWSAIGRERSALAADLSALDDAAWRSPSLCGDWSVEEVVAHLTAGASLGGWAWIRSMAGARLDPAVHNARRLSEHRGATPAQTLERFRAVATSRVAPSGHTAAWLGEIVVHGQDVRRPLGLRGSPDVATVTQVARFFAGRDFAVDSARAARGLRLEATDGAFATGDGPLVSGTTLALTMAMAGRTTYLDELSGQGVHALRARISR